MADSCYFCTYLNNEASKSTVLYEDDTIAMFMAEFPSSNGHCIITPKLHYSSLRAIDENILLQMMRASQRLVQVLSLSVENDWIQLILNDDFRVSQQVHLHMHVIPRQVNDGIDLNIQPIKANNESLNTLASELKQTWIDFVGEVHPE